MDIQSLEQHRSRRCSTVRMCLILLGLALFLCGCDPGGDSGNLTPQTTPSAPAEQQAIERLLDLYRQALVEEDIDRLQTLLASPAARAQAAPARHTARPAADGTFADLATFRQALSATFVTHAVTAIEIPAAEVVIAPDRRRVSFLEVESTLDPVSLTQATRVFRTTWQLARREVDAVVTFHIAAVTRRGPLVEVQTPGLLLAGPPAPVEVRTASATFTLAAADLTEPTTGVRQQLRATAGRVQGTFIAAATPAVARLNIRAVGTDGTVWAGGEGGRLYRVVPDTLSAELVGTLPEVVRIEDVLVDAQGRVQVVVVGSQRAGVIVHEANGFCQTVNVLDPAYPLGAVAK